MKKFLIIRFSSIGDIVLTTPVVRCLKTQFPEAEIHYLTKEVNASILESNPYIHKIHTFNKNLPQVINQLKKENFDYIIDLHNNLRSLRVKLSLFSVRSFSFNKLNIQKLFLVQFKWDIMPKIHIVDRYLATLKFLGVKNDNRGLDFFIPPTEEVLLENLPLGFQNGYAVVVVGSNHKTKQLTNEKIIQLIDQSPLPVVLLGGKTDIAKASEIVNGTQKTVFNGCGKFSLNQSASIVKQSLCVITPDTGLMHIAAAFNKSIISVWGNTVPEFGMYPYMPEMPSRFQVVEIKGLSCRPCSKIGYKNCPKKHFDCINKLNPTEIVSLMSVGR